MKNTMQAIRGWIDARDYRPILVSVLIVEAPAIAAMWLLCGFLRAPWWVMPTAIGSAVLLISWVILAVAALTRWLS